MSTASRADMAYPTLAEALAENDAFILQRMAQAIAKDPAQQQLSKYHREIKPGVFIDVYDVLKAFDVRCGALQHLIKKALAAGQRGHKDLSTDMDDIVKSAIRARELAE